VVFQTLEIVQLVQLFDLDLVSDLISRDLRRQVSNGLSLPPLLRGRTLLPLIRFLTNDCPVVVKFMLRVTNLNDVLQGRIHRVRSSRITQCSITEGIITQSITVIHNNPGIFHQTIRVIVQTENIHISVVMFQFLRLQCANHTNLNFLF